MPPVAVQKLINRQQSRALAVERLVNRTRNKRDELSNSKVRRRIKQIRNLWAEARTTNDKILDREDATELSYVSQQTFDTMEESFDNAIDELEDMMTENDVPATTDAVTPHHTPGSLESLSYAHKPKMPLPSFSGKADDDWVRFSELFKSLIHDDSRYSDASKYHFLSGCLTDMARDFVKDIPPTGVNYMSTWKALERRFYDPNAHADRQIQILLNLPSAKRESNAELQTLVDKTRSALRALKNVGLPVEHWDGLLVAMTANRLDAETRKLWESHRSLKEFDVLSHQTSERSQLPSFTKLEDLLGFIESRIKALSNIPVPAASIRATNPHSMKRAAPMKSFHAGVRNETPASTSKCPLCSQVHYLGRCERFLKGPVEQRKENAKRLRVCFNCLGKHNVRDCSSPRRCTVCNEKHHSTLHSVPSQATVILPTAQVILFGPRGRQTIGRALLDQGSEASFMTEALAQLLGLTRERVFVPLSGLGASTTGSANHLVRCSLRSSKAQSSSLEIEALVLPRLTGLIPSKEVHSKIRTLFSHLALADRLFHQPARADLILGADVYGQILRPGIFRAPRGRLIAQETILGWIVSGPVQAGTSRWAEASPRPSCYALHNTIEMNLQDSLQRFWELEEIPANSRTLSPEDQLCEDHFVETHSRELSGRYIVRLPLRSEPPAVSGETRRIALGSLSSIERRFSRDSKLAHEYRQFMKAYEDLGHMERVPEDQVHNPRAWYIPHHAVVQATPEKWKLRVVFDASRRTAEQISLNKILRAGPPLQRDLTLILTQWRRWSVVFTADIVKMFRQIEVHHDDQDLQRILWTPNPGEEPVDYRLKTVTYGTACAPYLAIRTLNQLAEDEGTKFPLGAQCLLEETYVDDIFSGADTTSTAQEKRDQLINLLLKGGITLDKWAANKRSLLPGGSSSSDNIHDIEIEMDSSVKTLGIRWTPASDRFGFKVQPAESKSNILTKRVVLSNVARLFDPLGWLASVTVTAKILLQDLWLLKVDWDTPLPPEAATRWTTYSEALPHLSKVSINRGLGCSPGATCELHAFSDASARAYAAAVYIRVQDLSGDVHVSLITAKSKVSPVKTITIPNLELCGAALLVRLVKHVQQVKFLKNLQVHAWSDSQVVLAWIRKHPSHWKTFVANRVCFIQTQLSSAIWRHVPTKDNPADLATRGIHPSEISNSDLWWHGPSWLKFPSDKWPKQLDYLESSENPTQVFTAQHQVPELGLVEDELITRFSVLGNLIRAVAIARRFMNRCRPSGRTISPPKFLSTNELKAAREAVIRLAQSTAFTSEIYLLRSGKFLNHHHHLSRLNPFIDESGVLRVGGRLSHSSLPYSAKHPPILPKKSHLSKLFIAEAHRLALHGGPTLTTNMLHNMVWIIGVTSLVKQHVRSCVTCHRAKPTFKPQMMGNLPANRIRPARPFSISGVDYAGPFQLRTTKGRGHKSYKGYISLFVCFATRAVHLEAVSDLSTASFMAAYRRFAGRRGICNTIYSDNGTNFQGAAKELRAMFNAASDFYTEVSNVLAKDGTSWSFIPAATPHFGGLWEAGVKSVKHHLRRVIGEHTLTFEEFSTLLVQIEACLNSRPLSPLSADLDSIDALTPAHFLIGSTLAVLPEAEPLNGPENRLSRFQLIQRIQATFWKRWSREYLHHLQERNKWRGPAENFAVGQLVVVQDDRYPPSKWPLGRILAVHPGEDGLVRVVTVKTSTSTYRRPIVRLSPLPTQSL